MQTKLILLAILALFNIQLFGQASGNVNYQYQVQLPDKPINIQLSTNEKDVISIKGLYNVKADAYVAIFSLTQAGKTAAEVNQLIDERINTVKFACENKAGVSIFVDMISFVPVFEYDVVKKIFSKKTYNEVPKGFELQKNLHVRYKDPNFLNDLLTACSSAEIYDLVRVDYFSDSLEMVKKQMMNKAKLLIDERLKNKAKITSKDYSAYDKEMWDGYKVVFPIEMYNAYQAYSCNSLKTSESSGAQQAPKNTTHYYKPYFDKNFDFVVNPIIFEPVIQVMYEIRVKYTPVPKEVVKPIVKKEVQIQKEIQIQKEVVIVTQTGEIKTIGLGTK